MRRIFILSAIFVMCQVAVFGQKKYEMVVEKTNGTEIAVNVEDIVRTYFRERTGGAGNDDAAYTTCPDANHPHWIDLGIGTQWRCCNAGASSPEGYGDYYTFDEAQADNPPSLDQIEALLNNCSSVWTTQNGVNGRKFTGPNGGTIFLPAAGGRWGGEFDVVGDWGYYWSSTTYDEVIGGVPTPDTGFIAHLLYFTSDKANKSLDDRYNELSVRPVR